MPLRILIVEDEPLIALHLSDLLQEDGHVVVGIVPSMIRALEAVPHEAPVDLAIMDVDLADGRVGVEAARRLRQEHDVTSLFVSANLDEETRARALPWKPVGFVGKPFQEDEILAALAPLESGRQP